MSINAVNTKCTKSQMALLKGFQAHVKFERGNSERTVKIYTDAIIAFKEWLGEKSLAKVGREDIRNWLAYMEERKLKPNTRLMALSSVKGFYNWLAGEEDFLRSRETKDILKLVHYLQTRVKIKKPKTIPIMPFRDEVDRIRDCMEQADGTDLKTFYQKGKPQKRRLKFLRDRAIIELLIASGLRNQELRYLRVEDIDLERNIISVKNGAKGGKQRPTLFNGRATKALKAYFAVLNGESHPFAICAYELERRVSFWTRKAGIQRNFTPHSFRHYWVTNLLEQGTNISAVSHMAGHASTRTTAIYTHWSIGRLKKEYDKCDI